MVPFSSVWEPWRTTTISTPSWRCPGILAPGSYFKRAADAPRTPSPKMRQIATPGRNGRHESDANVRGFTSIRSVVRRELEQPFTNDESSDLVDSFAYF